MSCDSDDVLVTQGRSHIKMITTSPPPPPLRTFYNNKIILNSMDDGGYDAVLSAMKYECDCILGILLLF